MLSQLFPVGLAYIDDEAQPMYLRVNEDWR